MEQQVAAGTEAHTILTDGVVVEVDGWRQRTL